MNKAQKKAVHDYCEDVGYPSVYALLSHLKKNGTISPSARYDELPEYVEGETYDDMYEFLVRNEL